MYKIRFLLIVCLMASCTPQPTQKADKQASATARTFQLPDVPALLTDPAERANYLSLHYWDHFDFADTTLISLPEVTEQAFANFIHLLPYTDRAAAALDTLVRRAATRTETLRHFISLTDKYLYEPNSPLCNEDFYIVALQSVINSPAVGEADKIRPRYRLAMALKNRPGEMAEDFTFIGRDERRTRLSAIRAPYLLVYFNDPKCEDCQRVKGLLQSSPVVNALLETGTLQLLSVCVEGKTAAWEKASFPARWIDGYDEGQRLTHERLYDLKAMPTLYLLDANKRVLLKDASVDRIEAWMKEGA